MTFLKNGTMTFVLPSDATASTMEHDPLVVNIEDGCCLQAASDPPTCSIRAAGVLKYNRESDNHGLNTTIPLKSTDLMVNSGRCEYCGEQARPSLDPACLVEPGQRTDLLFCCIQRQQLCELLVEEKCTLEGRHHLKTTTPSSLKTKRDRGMQEYNKFILDFPSEFRTLSDPSMPEKRIRRRADEDSAPSTNILRFRLSCAPQNGDWTIYPSSPTEECSQGEGEEAQLVTFRDTTTQRQFGLCHREDEAGFLQKFYSSGMKFLTVFPDGSAQAFYPSGRMAVIVVTEESGRLCIVYDDGNAPSQPIRAVFQSDGRATCYHSNGKIWLSLNTAGGQCLDELGRRVRRWRWSSLGLTSTPLHPVFLSLNRTIGVRVLRKEQVFVSFLAGGQQAKFSVGSANIQGILKTVQPAVLEEERFLVTARTRINRTIQHLHHYLKTPYHPRLPKNTQAAQKGS